MPAHRDPDDILKPELPGLDGLHWMHHINNNSSGAVALCVLANHGWDLYPFPNDRRPRRSEPSQTAPHPGNQHLGMVDSVAGVSTNPQYYLIGGWWWCI